MKTTILLSLTFSCIFLVSCVTSNDDRDNYADIASEVINSTLDSIKNTVFFHEDENDSIFLIVNNKKLITHFSDQNKSIEVPVADLKIREEGARFIESDTIFSNLTSEEVIKRNIRLERYFFVEFDTIYSSRNTLEVKGGMGPLGIKHYYNYYYDKDSFKLDNSELILRLIR